MKNAAILIIGVVVGFFIFSFLNPTPTETFSVKTRTIKQTNTAPVVVKETRYHGQESSPVEVNPPKSTTDDPLFIKYDKDKVPAVKETLAYRIQTKMEAKAFLEIQKLPFLAITDSRLVSLRGIYTGTFKLFGEGRTGQIEKAKLTMTDEMTELKLNDQYDNPNEEWSFNFNSSRIFKAMPGDLNLVILVTQIDSNYFILDLRSLPEIKGKAYSVSIPMGELELKRK